MKSGSSKSQTSGGGGNGNGSSTSDILGMVISRILTFHDKIAELVYKWGLVVSKSRRLAVKVLDRKGLISI